MRFVTGSLTDATESVIVHGCNSHGVMGAGVALAIRQKWPRVYDVYMSSSRSLGTFSSATIVDVPYNPLASKSKVVFNLITQINYGRVKGKKYAYYGAIYQGLVSIIQLHHMDHNEQKIAIPKIGSGLGGLQWPIVQVLLEEIEQIYKVEFVVYDLEGVK